MTQITEARAAFLASLISPNIMKFVEERLASKELKLPIQINQLESEYHAQMGKFYDKVFSGQPATLPPSNLMGVALNQLRQVDLKNAQMNNLLATVCFDKENNISVKYIVDQGGSLESWAVNNQVDSKNVKSMLDSYFLEFFNEKGLQIIDGKLQQINNGQVITEEGFNNLLKDTKGLKDKFTQSGKVKEVGINTERLDKSIENLVRNLNI